MNHYYHNNYLQELEDIIDECLSLIYYKEINKVNKLIDKFDNGTIFLVEEDEKKEESTEKKDESEEKNKAQELISDEKVRKNCEEMGKVFGIQQQMRSFIDKVASNKLGQWLALKAMRSFGSTKEWIQNHEDPEKAIKILRKRISTSKHPWRDILNIGQALRDHNIRKAERREKNVDKMQSKMQNVLDNKMINPDTKKTLEKNYRKLQALIEKEKNGTITDEEKQKLKELNTQIQRQTTNLTTTSRAIIARAQMIKYNALLGYINPHDTQTTQTIIDNIHKFQNAIREAYNDPKNESKLEAVKKLDKEMQVLKKKILDISLKRLNQHLRREKKPEVTVPTPINNGSYGYAKKVEVEGRNGAKIPKKMAQDAITLLTQLEFVRKQNKAGTITTKDIRRVFGRNKLTDKLEMRSDAGLLNKYEDKKENELNESISFIIYDI